MGIYALMGRHYLPLFIDDYTNNAPASAPPRYALAPPGSRTRIAACRRLRNRGSRCWAFPGGPGRGCKGGGTRAGGSVL